MTAKAKRPFMETLVVIIGIADVTTAMLIYIWGLPAEYRGDRILPFVCLMAGVFAGTLVHELGHAAAAVICGWRIIIFGVRPVALRFRNPALVLGGKRSFPHVRGFVVAVPDQAGVLTRRRWVAFIAGGPAASLLFALYLGLLALAFAHAALPTAYTKFLAALCAGFGIHSFCTCVRTLLPRGPATDGAKLLAARARTKPLPQLSVGFWVAVLMRYRIRARDLPGWMVEALQTDPAQQRSHASIAIARLLDAKTPDYAEARRQIEIFREKYGVSEWLCACDAYVAALHEGDTARAARALAVPHAQHPAPALTLAAKAALSARAGLPRQTRRHLSDMEKILARASPFKDRAYADARKNIEAVLRASSSASSHASGKDHAGAFTRGSVPYHAD